MNNPKLTKKWLKEHGYHQDCCSPAYLYNNYGIKGKDNRLLDEPLSGWYVFIKDTELKRQ